MKVAVLFCLMGVALAAPQQLVQKTEAELIEELPEPYQFSLHIADDETTNYHQRSESQDADGKVSGQYAFVAPNGIRYITTYTADKDNGYQANTVEEQTNIIIVTPKPYVESQAVHAGQRF